MNKILTISVAAYNLETMIEDNLKSFEKCENKEKLEIIVTDDGSKDSTASIVQKYVDKYPTVFKLVQQKNAGAGSTVNSGIKHATGKYFKMIDGDDWVISENMDKLLDLLEKSDADIVLTNMQVYNETLKKIISYDKAGIKPCVGAKFTDLCANLSLNMHFVTYKTSILKDNNIVLDNGFYTDVEYLLLPVPYLETIDAYDLDIYVYRVARSGQSVSIPSMQKHLDMHDLVLKRLIKYYNDLKDIDPAAKTYMRNRIAFMADTQLGTLLSFNNSETKNTIKSFNKEIKDLNEEIYSVYSKKKKCKLLRYSGYLLVKPLAKIYIKKNS